MNPLVEKIYYKSPIFMQNIMTSFYGIILKNRRFGGNSSEYVEELLKTQFFSKDEITEYQNIKFNRIARHALETVPFYKKWLQESGIHPNEIKDVRDISKLPIITKDKVRENPKQYCSTNSLNKKGVFILSTSGTSGTPLTIFCDRESRRYHYAFFTRLRSWFNIKKGDKRATFFGRIIIDPDQTSPPFWRYDFNQKNMLFSSYHLSENNLPYYYKELQRFSPDEIIGYPSSIFLLAKFIKKNKLDKINAKVVITTAETLLEHQRQLIEDCFNCPIVDQYGCTEMTHFVSQCEHGTYHVHPEHGIIEVVDERDKPVRTGKSGTAVCTGFVNFSMPLLRYKVGDAIKLGYENCGCGRHFPVIKEIIGRVDDILITPDGRPLGRLDPVFKGNSGIYETQIIQTSIDCLEFYIAVDYSFSLEKKRELIREIKKRIGNKMHIKITEVDYIPKDKNGKFKAVISKI